MPPGDEALAEAVLAPRWPAGLRVLRFAFWALCLELRFGLRLKPAFLADVCGGPCVLDMRFGLLRLALPSRPHPNPVLARFKQHTQYLWQTTEGTAFTHSISQGLSFCV